MVTMVCLVSRFKLKALPGISFSCIPPLASSGQRSRASWASQPQKSATLSPQAGGKPRKFIITCGGIGPKNKCCGQTCCPPPSTSSGWRKFTFKVLPAFGNKALWLFIHSNEIFKIWGPRPPCSNWACLSIVVMIMTTAKDEDVHNFVLSFLQFVLV